MSIASKHLYLWCQRQSTWIVGRARPDHSYIFPMPCNGSLKEFFGFEVEPGEHFVLHLGEGGNYKLSREDVIKLTQDLGISPKAARPWINKEKHDLMGRVIDGR